MHGILTSTSAKNIVILILRVSIELADHSIFRMHTKKKFFCNVNAVIRYHSGIG